MAQVPVKVAARLQAGIKHFQPILASGKSRDVNESDTVIIVTDMLSSVFGYDKYSEVTSECAIRGTWCDLGIKVDGAFQYLIEVKAIGLDLKEAHTKQAVDYSANQGTDWVILTNGDVWRVYKITFAKPIGQELVLEFSFSQLNPKKSGDIGLLYHLTREGLVKSTLGEFHAQRQALSRFFLGATVLSDPVLEVIRRELRRLSPDVRIDLEQIKSALTLDVLKREVVEARKLQRQGRESAGQPAERLERSLEKTSRRPSSRERPTRLSYRSMESLRRNLKQRDNSRVDRSARSGFDVNLEFHTRARSRERWRCIRGMLVRNTDLR